MALDADMELDLDQALAEAHVPSLMMALVHLTGDLRDLDGPRPVYDFFGDGQGGLPTELLNDVRARARAAIKAYRNGAPLAPVPDEATIRKMMDFISGAEIPRHYLPLMMEELSLDGSDHKKPTWKASELGEQAQAIKVLIIGAGMSGLLTAIRLDQAGVAYEIIDKNADVGGTWHENSYPGCRVDNPSHLYAYSFEPNHDWPNHYSDRNALYAYFRKVADKYGLRSRVRYQTEISEARWEDATQQWVATLKDKDGKVTTERFTAVVSAVGQLNQPNMPDIKGVGRFKGPAFHSARWDHSVDLTGKRVAVIGTGASAFQFVPEIAPKVAHLDVFQRTPPWLGPTPNYHDPVSDGQKWLLHNVPFYDRWYRFWMFWTMTDGIYDGVRADPDWKGPTTAVSEVNHVLREMLVAEIAKQCEDRPDLLEKVVPVYPMGGKRSVRDNGVWISALKRPNVDLITDPITEVTEDGVATRDAGVHKADVLIYGTGFKASDFLRTFKVVGREGKELHDDVWKGDARAYLGMTVPGFPNFFVLYGPNTNIVVNGSIIFFSECSVRYLMGCLELLAKDKRHSLEVRPDVTVAFNKKVDDGNAVMAWGVERVNSWYKNATGRVSQNWPFPLIDYWNATLKPNPDDFVIR